MATTIKDKVQEAVTKLETEVRAVAKREDDDEVALKPHPPASPEEIRRYEQHLGLKLPPSYRAFLELFNGYDWLVYPGHLLSIRDAMPGGAWYKKIQAWKKMAAEYGSGEVLDGIAIANLGQPNNWAYLDPDQETGQGEFKVVRWLSGTPSTYKNFLEFLKARIEFCQEY